MMENPCMVIGGIVQPAIFEGIKGVLNTEERGFIQRLIVYAPKIAWASELSHTTSTQLDRRRLPRAGA